jgi:hypothetical protein
MKLLAAVGLLLAAGLALSGCADAAPAAPASTPSPSPSPTASSSVEPFRVAADTAGSDGFTVRYQGEDGRTKTLRVEDFRR